MKRWYVFWFIILIAGWLGSLPIEAATAPSIRIISAQKNIAAGGHHSLIISGENTMYAWGHNGAGRLGNITAGDKSGTPVIVNGPGGTDVFQNVMAIAGGTFHSLALKHDGTVWTWGSNGSGQLGNTSVGTYSNSPIQVMDAGGNSYFTNCIYISGGETHSVAVKSDGSVWSWGDNSVGQLGSNSSYNSALPIKVTGASGNGTLDHIIAVSAGIYHTIALKNDGTVWAWGSNNLGQLGNELYPVYSKFPVPVVTEQGALSDIIAIAAGDSHNLALHKSGIIYAWGDNAKGQLGNWTTGGIRSTPAPVKSFDGVNDLIHVVDIAAGSSHSVAILNDETVAAWGDNQLGRLGNNTFVDSSIPVRVKTTDGITNLEGIVAIDVGNSHNLAFKRDGTVWSWGANYYGQLGDSTFTARNKAVQVHGIDNIGMFMPGVPSVQITTLEDQKSPSVFLSVRDPDGATLTLTAKSSNPLLIPDDQILFLGKYKAYTLDVTSTSKAELTLTMMPAKDQAGTAKITITVKDETLQRHEAYISFVVKAVNDPPTISHIAGFSISEDTQTDPILFTIADPDSYSVSVTAQSSNTDLVPNNPLNMILAGDGNQKTLTVIPTKNRAGTTLITLIAADSDGLTATSTFILGVEGINDPPQIFIHPHIKQIATGFYHTLALKQDGTVWAWGANSSGQLGINSTEQKSYPVQVKNASGTGFLTDIAAIAAGALHSLAVTNEGTLLAWGDNSEGQLGNGTYQNARLPTQVNGPGAGILTDATLIAAGAYHSLAVQKTDALIAWGKNTEGQLGNGEVVSTNKPVIVNNIGKDYKIIAIAAGVSHSIALKSDKTVWTWGDNTIGQLGNNATVASYIPVQVHGKNNNGYLTDIVSIASGSYHSIALHESGVVYAWGNNYNGQLGNGTTFQMQTPTQVLSEKGSGVLDNVIAIASGAYHSLAIKNDTTIVAWGMNETGQIGNGTSGTNTDAKIPVVVKTPDGKSNLTECIGISAGYSHSIAHRLDGGLLAWGANFSNQLGDGSRTLRNLPVYVKTGISDSLFYVPLVSLNLSIVAGDANPVVRFSVADVETDSNSLSISANSSNLSLVPNTVSNLIFEGTGPNRTLTIVPEVGQTGIAKITITVSDGAASDADALTLSVEKELFSPTISTIQDQFTDEDLPIYSIPFTLSDLDTPTHLISVSARSSDPTIISEDDAHMIFSGTGSDRILTLIPLTNANGQVRIYLSATDGEKETTINFLVTIHPVNDRPEITTIDDVQIYEDTTTNPIAFKASDPETSVDKLTISVLSSNPNLVPNDPDHLVLGGAGENRTIRISPAHDRSGSSIISVSVNDGEKNSSETFTLTVLPVNDPPFIEDIENQTAKEDHPLTILFTIGDVDSPVESLLVSASSSNQLLVPIGRISLSGTGTSRTMVITPMNDANGSTDITVKVSDASSLTNTKTFKLTIEPGNDPPTISLIADQLIKENSSTNPISFSIWDLETPAEDLEVFGLSSNVELVPNDRIIITGNASNRMVQVTPLPNMFGTAIISIGVNDGIESSVRSFNLEVESLNAKPVLSSISDQMTRKNSPLTLTVTVQDAETAATDLILTVTSTNQTLVANNHIQVEKNNTIRVISIVPAIDQTGQTTINLQLFDGLHTIQQSFQLVVNTPPWISPIPDQTILEDSVLGPIAFTITDVDSPLNQIALTVSSSNETLVPLNRITLTGTGTSRAITITPVENFKGVATIELTASDSIDQSKRSFVLTVDASNDVPTISSISDQVIPMNGTTSLIQFSISDDETPSHLLIVTAHSSNLVLVPENRIQHGGSGEKRSVIITPTTNQRGIALITIIVTDSEGKYSEETFNVFVGSKPVAFSDTLYIEPGEITNGILRGNDSDNDTLQFSVVTQPTYGTVTMIDATKGTYQYHPGQTSFQSDSFTFHVSDGVIYSDNATITIYVRGADRTPPVITLPSENPLWLLKNTVYTPQKASAYDETDGALGQINPVGTVNTSVPGTYYILYSIKDSSGNIAQKILTIQILDVTGTLEGSILNVSTAIPTNDITIKLLDPISGDVLRQIHPTIQRQYQFNNLAWQNYILQVTIEDADSDPPAYVREDVSESILFNQQRMIQNITIPSLTPIENGVHVVVHVAGDYNSSDEYNYSFIDADTGDSIRDVSGFTGPVFDEYLKAGTYRLIIIAKKYAPYEYKDSETQATIFQLIPSNPPTDYHLNVLLEADDDFNPYPPTVDVSHIISDDPNSLIDGFLLWFVRRNYSPESPFSMSIETMTGEFFLPDSIYHAEAMVDGQPYVYTWSTSSGLYTSKELNPSNDNTYTYQVTFNFYAGAKRIDSYTVKYVSYSPDYQDIEKERAFFEELMHERVLYETQSKAEFYPLVPKTFQITFKDEYGNEWHKAIHLPAIPLEYFYILNEPSSTISAGDPLTITVRYYTFSNNAISNGVSIGLKTKTNKTVLYNPSGVLRDYNAPKITIPLLINKNNSFVKTFSRFSDIKNHVTVLVREIRGYYERFESEHLPLVVQDDGLVLLEVQHLSAFTLWGVSNNISNGLLYPGIDQARCFIESSTKNNDTMSMQWMIYLIIFIIITGSLVMMIRRSP